MNRYYKEDYEKIGELVSKSGENLALTLIGLFNPLLYKYCRLGGRKDEDLYSELIIALLKCVKRFQVDRLKYLQIYQVYYGLERHGGEVCANIGKHREGSLPQH